MGNQQVRSKQRVADYGEVFTAAREVNAMLDLVKDETQRIDSRFLEPACGEGAFLTEILRRKLAVVKGRYKKSPFDYERYAILALMSIYGVELLEDNAESCRQNLFTIWNTEYTAVMRQQASEECRSTARYILRKNILCGDALTMLQADGTPIVFAEWSLVSGGMVKRRDYTLDELLRKSEQKSEIDEVYQTSLEGKDKAAEILPTPIREYPLTDYRRLAQYE
ncbi:MAG: SAM-dependent DNA methyltransferase [Subdoligranulum sp.]|nr:SAM-dependent DNA methyltransferase [Subdoligranulum sp.]